MPWTIPEARERFAELDRAGIKYTDQVDGRLYLLERQLDELSEYVEQLEGGLLTKIDGKPRPNWPDPEQEQSALDL